MATNRSARPAQMQRGPDRYNAHWRGCYWRVEGALGLLAAGHIVLSIVWGVREGVTGIGLSVYFLTLPFVLTLEMMYFWYATVQNRINKWFGVFIRTVSMLLLVLAVGILGLITFFGILWTGDVMAKLLFVVLVLPGCLVLAVSAEAAVRIPLRMDAPVGELKPSAADLSTTLPEEGLQTGDWDEAKPEADDTPSQR